MLKPDDINFFKNLDFSHRKLASSVENNHFTRDDMRPKSAGAGSVSDSH